jgi:polyhydroxyalkanoate synthesis regulator phasin
MKFNKLALAVTSAVLLMAGNVALADSTSDIVNVLVDKGILTPEEGKLISKNSVEEKKKAQKESGKIKISDAIDNATIYGSFRFREEYRTGSGDVSTTKTADFNRTRSRGKFELGVSTNAGNWYSDIALVTGSDSSARSDNFTFGGATSSISTATCPSCNQGFNPKETIYLKRAMLGWKATDWLTLEGGRTKNPLYTTQMMWDPDYTTSGLTEKLSYKQGNLDLFATLGQWAHYKMDRTLKTNYSDGSADAAATTGEIYATQAGAKYTFNDRASAKAAVTYYAYGSPAGRGTFGSANKLTLAGAAGTYDAQYGVNNLNVWEVPFEANYMVTDTIGARFYGDWAINTDADARANLAGVTSNIDDTAWMLGFVVGSAKDLKSFESGKAKAGDWMANLWYQEIGLFAVDPALGDSDIFDSRLNMKGTTFKGQYLVEDNVALNLTYAHGTRLNSNFITVSSAGQDLSGLNLHSYDLLQADVTYKF